jgi:hypothetical protein
MKSRAPGRDQEILAHADACWRKVARILFRVMDKSFPNRFGRPQLIESRIQALARAGAIEGRGILFMSRRAPPWAVRFSEMRLPPRGRRLTKRQD